MIFDTFAYIRFVMDKVNHFNNTTSELFSKLNPELIEKIKSNREAFNEDGSPVKELTKETIDKMTKEIASDIEVPSIPQEVIDTLAITLEDLKQFIKYDNDNT